MQALTLQDATAKAELIARGLRSAARTSRVPISFVSGGGGFRARKGQKLLFRSLIASFVIIVVLPMLAASVYYGLIATRQYSTEVRFSLKSGEPSVLDSLSGLTGLASSQQSQDSQIIVNFIRSRAMAEAIDREFDFRRLYSSNEIDLLSRFDPEKPIEDLVLYWRSRVDALLEGQSGIITVDVRAFSAEESLRLANRIVELSEQLVNQMSERSRRTLLQQAKVELDRAEQRLRGASSTMRDIRNSEGILDVKVAAEASGKVISALKIELAGRESEYNVRLQNVSAEAPQMRILNAQIVNLKQQIAKFTDEVAGLNTNRPSRTLADSLSTLDRFQIELTLAQQQYASAASAYENARVDLDTQQAYLVTFLKPTLAEKSLYPKRWWNWSIIVFPALFLWFLMLGVAFLIRDYMAA